MTGTTERRQALLSFDEDFALQYVKLWLASNGSLKVPDSGVMRRALAVYVEYLEGVAGRDEVAAVRRTCRALKPNQEDQQRALLRLYAFEPGQPLLACRELRRNPEARQQFEAFNDRVDVLVAEAMKERPISSKVRTYINRGLTA